MLKQNLYLLTLIGISISAMSCFPNENTDLEVDSIDINLLANHWVHSMEEEELDDDFQENIFRPNDYKDFPASWFRLKYIIYEDGTFDWLFLAPNDAHYFKSGTWWIDPEQENHIYFQKESTPVKYRVLSLSEELLEIEPVE